MRLTDSWRPAMKFATNMLSTASVATIAEMMSDSKRMLNE